ncbi:Crp/Fnr family transcriptional regulator [Alicyclobacillus cycloheptanicus]|jgi:CRP/FNR family transcriptional regulator|uniref:CRP/FNR family transcriptional regulator n=1 Tax=Alicyclobacillus cycloheptanicus TaxID=1457 RepID=A0ABT9XL62_9BACL|nr:Crp/Fnr family transcriptional regulator [Alicyclobacillus cycloheptanicus]MDQ0191054.1 CRP/FNR family transcriptional regulator [Alicyclobacillus cycloheptanicus]WDM00850.1 Crp/Fnr family transcriptional regulator [Alicyclobacillus cycloheptanicus]
MSSAVELLKQISLFKDLTPTELEHVHELAVEHHYERGAYVFMEGQDREAVYFIGRGLIKVLKVDDEGREHIVNILGRGAMFPHVGFFQDTPYPGTAQAMEPSDLLSIRCRQFDELLTENPEIARKVMRVMGERILMLQSKLQELASFDSHERVVALLRHFAEEHGEPGPGGVHVKLPITHGEMAHMIGMTRESVNRIWNQLRRDGVLSGERDAWVLHLEKLNHGQ